MEAQNNLTAKERLNKIDIALDNYEKSVGLPSCTSPGTEDELQQFLIMGRHELESLTPEACASMRCRLSQYSFYLQRLFNREKTRTIWARQQLTETVAKSVDDFDKFMKFEIKVAKIIKDNSYAESIQKIIIYSEQRTQRLEFLSTALKNLSDSLRDIQTAKIQLIRNP